MQTQQTLDARGLNCPLPVLRTKKSLNTLQSGETLKVVATDPGALKDIASFCSQTGHALLATQQSGGEYEFIIQKA
ncbi:MAG: sulfurtransferase TusA family protein [Thiotrichales bacterium]